MNITCSTAVNAWSDHPHVKAGIIFQCSKLLGICASYVGPPLLLHSHIVVHLDVALLEMGRYLAPPRCEIITAYHETEATVGAPETLSHSCEQNSSQC